MVYIDIYLLSIKAKLEEIKRIREQVALIIQPVEERELDSQQLDSIACKAYNQLILAGAGTDKTTAVIGKVKYLLRTCKYKPEEFLLLAFTNKSVAEMKERVHSETGYTLDVKIFHKLGLDIITEANEKKTSVFSKLIQEYIRHNLKIMICHPDQCPLYQGGLFCRIQYLPLEVEHDTYEKRDLICGFIINSVFVKKHFLPAVKINKLLKYAYNMTE